MIRKIIISLFVFILLIGIVFSAGETTTPATTTTPSEGKTVEVGATENIGDLIGKGLDITASKVELTKGDKEDTLTFLEGGSVNVEGASFKNVEKSSSIVLDNLGEIKSADLTANADTSFDFKGVGTYNVLKGERVKYEGGKATIYGKAGNSVGFTPEILDESGKDIGKLMNIKMNGDSVNIEKGAEGSSVLTGDFVMGDNKISGIGNNPGEITISNKDGRISEIWEGTDATMKNVDFKVSGDNLKMYYDASFNPSEHKGENYFDYGTAKISAGGTGFTSDLTKSTNIFGDMKTTSEVAGIGTKTRGLDITMDGGNLEISKDTSNSKDLAFNINGNGDYIINDGRDVIYSQKNPVNAGNLPGKDEISVKTNLGEGSSYGLSSSYNLNINNGEYTLKDNLFEDSSGNVLVNANTPWENAVYVAKNIDSKEANTLRTKMEKEDKMIYVDDPNFLTWIKGEDGEAIMKEVYTSTDIANQNKYGVQVSPLQVYGAMKSEGWGYKPESDYVPQFGQLIKDPNMEVNGIYVGLTNSGGPQDIKALKDGGFIPKDLDVTTVINDQWSSPALKAKDAFTYFAGVFAQKEYFFQRDFTALYGEEAYNSLTPDETSYWTTYYFNAGEGAGKNALKNIEQNYVAVWEGGKPSTPYTGNPQFNSRLRTDFEEYLQELGLFNYP